MSEPDCFFQGDTVEWDRALPLYPAPQWTLTYHFSNAANSFDIVAAANGDDYRVNITAIESNVLKPGDYGWVAKVKDGVIVHTVLAGKTKINPNLENSSTFDTRPWQVVALEAVEAVLANRATMDQESYSIQGRSLSRTPLVDLLNYRKTLQAEVASMPNPCGYVEEDPGPSTKRARVRF